MRLKHAIEKLNPSLDCGIVLKNENIFYLTGFFPTAFAVLVVTDEPYIAVSEMDAQLAQEVDVEVRVMKSFKKELSFTGRVGIEKRYTTISFVETYLNKCELEDLRFLDEMRQIKDSDEVGMIKKAIRITEDTLHQLRTEGCTEKDVAAQLAFEMSKSGGIAFDPIVASGVASSIPHHTPSEKKIKASEHTIIDLGARFRHYNCDMTRTLTDAPSERFREVYEAVLEAQKTGISHITPGSSAKDCDTAVREVLKEYSLDDYFVHSSGHGIGLDVHEAPRISRESEDVFKEGMVVSIEPAVYIPGWGGVRIEDVIHVGKKPTVLTSFPK